MEFIPSQPQSNAAKKTKTLPSQKSGVALHLMSVCSIIENRKLQKIVKNKLKSFVFTRKCSYFVIFYYMYFSLVFIFKAETVHFDHL